MIITSKGHSRFLIELADGHKIITDPFDASTGYPVGNLSADVVLVSHGHHDHSAVETISGDPIVINKAGTYQPLPDVHVTAVPCWHDDVQGAKRGPNLIFLVEAEGLRLVHLGDLGHIPATEQAALLAPIDVLMIPVGGFFTIDAAQAKAVCELFSPRIIIPMHYRTAFNAQWPIGPVDDFLNLIGKPAETLQLLRLTKQDMECQPELAVLTLQM